jgi:hypothetical protein
MSWSNLQWHKQRHLIRAYAGGRCRRVSITQVRKREGEHALVESHMPRSEYSTRHRIKTPVAAVIRRIPEEDAGDGAMIKFMSRGGGGVWVAEAPEDAKKSVIRCSAEKKLMWSARSTGSTWPAIQQVRGSA